ncbi:N-acetyltransferase [candidate division KSB1 bacterium]|nr:N-acetyltransferase [candidate division KSB1 bacterium]
MTSIQDIHESVQVGEGSQLGSFCVIEKDVQIGKACQIGHHVVIHQGSRIGDNIRIDAHSVIGKSPMRAARSIFQKSEDLPPTQIGNGCMIGAQVVIYEGCDLGSHCLVADGAAVRENVQIGEYTIIGRLVTVENYSKIGKKCKLETGCYITAYSTLGDYCFIAPRVTTTNDNFLGRTEERFKHFKGVTVKTGGRIGANATILPGKTIGEDAVVGAASVVTKDVPDKTVVVGVPAREYGQTPEEQLLENQDWD